MAGTAVTFGTNATLDGRALAATVNVVLDSNTITRRPCAVAGAGGVGAGDGSTSLASGNPFTTVAAAAMVVTGFAVMVVYATRRRDRG